MSQENMLTEALSHGEALPYEREFANWGADKQRIIVLSRGVLGLRAQVERLTRERDESERLGILKAIGRVKELGQTTMGSVITELRLLSGETMEDICRKK